LCTRHAMRASSAATTASPKTSELQASQGPLSGAG
jgi:hypothetical protein